MEELRANLKNKKRVVVKIGSSSLQHPETGELDYIKIDILVRELCNLQNQGKDVILVTSGSISCGRKAIGLKETKTVSQKQACAAIGQARLMTTYQKIFSEYNHYAAQILMTRNTIVDNVNRFNAQNTFNELLSMGVIPVVNENDTISTFELDKVVGENDTLSAIVTALTNADLLILLSDINGLYTDDPRQNKDAQFIERVDCLTDELMQMGKASTGSSVGTGGMETKMIAAKIATYSGADMVIASGKDVRIIHRIMEGRNYGTIFKANKNETFDFAAFLDQLHK
ncbi:MAG: glutamate 5-kinase [Lachnospiraceae bacterium]|mgnify:FL=1|jgi:glutamate 5-kinase|nr:glutamate 5-kinase [Lachnospiraceae bacterium]